MKTEADTVKLNNEILYKTPNYKGKKKSSSNYMTKHNTSDIKGHEALMKKKYGVKLSVRKDVVNKTLFRALKRFYTEKFMEIFSLSKKESSESYMLKIRSFCIIILESKMESLEKNNLTFEQIEKFLSIVISPNHVKNLLDSEDLALHKEFYSCLYQYSHKRLAKMLMSPVCGYLFTDFVISGNLTQFITACPTMSQNFETYEIASRNFLLIIMGKDKKANKAFSSPRSATSVF